MSESVTLFTLIGSDAPADCDVPTLLGSRDRKARMAAYAYIYSNPDPVWVSGLVDAVVVEGTRFGQYWGVRALRRSVDANPGALDVATRGRLEQFAATLASETDGADELRQLLGGLPA